MQTEVPDVDWVEEWAASCIETIKPATQTTLNRSVRVNAACLEVCRTRVPGASFPNDNLKIPLWLMVCQFDPNW